MFPCRLIFLGCLLSSPLQAGLLAHWKLDSTPADEVDSFPATWNAIPGYTPGVAAPSSIAAADLAGNWLGAGTGINFDRGQAFSATAWIKGGTQDSAIIGDMVGDGDSKGWELHVGTTENGGDANSVTVLLVNDHPSIAIQVNASVNVLDGQWHHIAFTYDGSSTAAGVKIHIDGTSVPTTTGIDTLAAGIANNDAAGLNIGTRMDGAGFTFTGSIDEVALFDHVLTAQEVNSVFLTGVESVTFPTITATIPQPGQSVTTLTSADVIFSFPVGGVDAGDLLVNGAPSVTVQATGSKTYRFTFPSPPQGDVNFTWAAGHGIAGLNGTPAQPQGWLARFVPVLPPGQVAIAEFVCKNAGGLEDEDHDTPDWIELLNPGTATVNLAGWALTDDPARPRAWVLPAISLAPGSRKIVFASGKNRRPLTGSLHADFKLADDGGYLALSDPSGSLVHVYDSYPRQEGNVSFGLHSSGKPADGRAAWRYMSPTPNAGANGTTYSGAVISEMKSTPANPVAGQAITVTIRTSPEAVLNAPPRLYHRVMHGAENFVNFADDGLHGDGAAGDLVWGATIPAGATAGQMVRWRAMLTSGSIVSRWPVNGVSNALLPIYEGTVIGGNTASQVLPVYQIFVDGYQFPTGTNQTGIDSTSGGRGAFYGNGKLYDNVFIRTKGTTSLNLFKRSHRVDFNPGRDFEWSPDHDPQRELNLNSEYNDPSYLRQNQQHWMHRDSGNAGAPHFPVRLLMNGANWQLAFHTYSADSELIKVLGLDPRGALYKQVGTLSTGAGGEKKSRKWEGTQDFTNFKNGIASSRTPAEKLLYLHDNTNLPAVINYLAVTRLAQEGDDVWANMVIYRDSDGTGEWRPIPFDLNLSFGQLFYGFGPPYNTTIQATNDANKSHPLYGSSACLSNTGSVGEWNRLYDAVIQNPLTRSMLLRRIRTLMDRYLSESAATSPLEANFDTLGALIRKDADIDRARWGLPPNALAYGLGPGITPEQGLATLKSAFLAPRRTHFYTTHSSNNPGKTLGIGNNNKAGIPDAQTASPVINFGTVEAHPANGNQNQEYIQLSNPSAAAADISDWTVRGSGGSFKIKGGTVIPASGSLFVSPDVVSFRARTTSPKANENRYVVGPYSGHLSPYGETLRLENASGQTVAQIQVPADPKAPPVSLAVTEIMSSSAHTNTKLNGDWWELTNTGTTSLDLTGFSYDDNHDLAGQTVFPNFILKAGESLIILNEDDAGEAALFRNTWGLPDTVRILTREDFGIEDLVGLGGNDSVIVYQPNGTRVARADYTAHTAGRSRAWFRNGTAIPGGYSQLQKYGAVKSDQAPSDLGSPGFSAADPATFIQPYDIWAAANDLWHATDTMATADPDNDGRTNREEYIFGGHARQSDGPPPQAILSVPDGYQWTFVLRADDPSLSITLEGSADLIQWTTITPTLVGETPHPTLTGYKSATYLVSRDTGTKFLRARAD
ncbi:lamin tail domain-containing protein [Luteolibacter yonseiensis]|uniref:Lamin tail domain-containing protein n=1 Tax=Luteolibacter yonseiensis TaxID=1144680 RepID=A0A934VE61_9BACT|nr:lamin tail domain-containing protein [Luteolibacter yonseiensis]MBK1818289.1 lamin tail domain-containing protein [Luteolibacter yonseiensis]